MNNPLPITQFIGPYNWLSNIYPTRLVYQSYAYYSAEHAFLAQKSADRSWKLRCCDIRIPISQLKTESYKIKLIDNWDTIKHKVMEEILSIKFSNPQLRKWLLDTVDAPILYGNNWGDVYWGVDIKTLEGKNHLGKIIMKIRYQLTNIYDSEGLGDDKRPEEQSSKV